MFARTILMLAGAVTVVAAEFTVAPSLVPNPNPAVPLAALVRFSTTAPVSTRVTITEGSRTWNVDFGPQADPAWELPLIGFYPGKRHSLSTALAVASLPAPRP